MIDSLPYLIPDRLSIMFSPFLCAWFENDPKKSHLTAIKRIFRYLVGTKDIGLQYPKDRDFNVIRYSDANYVGYKVYRKSTSGYCQFLGHSLASQKSNKQALLLYLLLRLHITASACCAQILYITYQLRDFGFGFQKVPIR